LSIVVPMFSGGDTTTAPPPPEQQTALPTTAPKATKPAPAPATPAAPVAPGKLTDDDWVLQSYQFKNDGLGDFGGTARITNNSGEARSASFTLTLFKSGEQVASLQGSADEVDPGKTVTVQLISQDKYQRGTFQVDFQVDFSY
jgi:hypothetical protein